jgi:hypothetical protein
MIVRAKLKSQKKETWVITWALYFAGATINLVAVTELSIEAAAYPIIVFIMNGIVFSITLRKYIWNSKSCDIEYNKHYEIP